MRNSAGSPPAAREAAPDSEEHRRLARAAAASLVGTLIEWYDFFLFAAMSALIFNHVFFPATDDTAGTLASFTTFGAGFVARPVGSLVVGHLGDRVGRKAAMVTSLLVMGGSTFAIGLVPSHAAIGLAAPLVLTTLRFAQGMALGGEWSGAATLVMEHAPKDRRGRWAAWVQYGALAGIALSSGTVLVLVETLDDHQLFTWGWRIPFLASGVLVLIGLFVRLRVEESPAFRALAGPSDLVRVPAWEALRRHSRAVVLVAGMHLVVVAYATTLLTYVLRYGVAEVGLSRTDMLFVVFAGAAIAAAVAPAFGVMTDRVGRRRMYVCATGLAAVGVFPAFALLNTGSIPAGVGAVMLFTVPIAMAFQVQGAYFPEQFPVLTRVTGAGLGASLASAAVGGPAPAVAQALARATGGTPWLVATYLSAVACLSLACALATPDLQSRRRYPRAVTQRWSVAKASAAGDASQPAVPIASGAGAEVST
jgi:MFS family permease